jgi:CheY-like chemotaxis protein
MSVPPASHAAGAPSSLKVLVVDDHVDSAEALSMLLEVFGHEVRSCHDGQAAVDQAAQWQPDLVLMDLSLPILTGYEAARQIVAGRTAAQPHCPMLVALSGHSGAAEREQSLQAGFVRHLVKPVAPDVLQAVLDEGLRARS